MTGKTPIHSLSWAACCVALLSGGLTASRPGMGADAGLYGMTAASLTRMQPTRSDIGASFTNADANKVGMRIGMGYQQNEAFAYECTLGALGRADGNAVSGRATWGAAGYGCGALVLIPADERLSWFLKGGMQKVRVQMTSSGTTNEVRHWSPSFAMGIRRTFSKVAGWRVEYEQVFGAGDARQTGEFELKALLFSVYFGF